MIFPYQCLVARTDSDDSNKWTVFGASGSKLVAQSSTGATSVWPQQDEQQQQIVSAEHGEPPGKRIKLSPAPTERGPNFSSIILSSNGEYLIGVTGEDKCIRVFQVDKEGQFQQLSERCMSRKPSSITLTSDDFTILCADKFGDVYALPLIPSPNDEPAENPVVTEQPVDKDFTPSATVLTVHSGRNRRTLEEQLKQKAKGPLKTKEAMTFKHDLLLGHVSMLTDLAYAKKGNRSYIITADRDEHIRISRGVPQAHIIEGFCLGHEEFISRLCLTPLKLLVSGGGDACLYVWDWQNYRLVERLPLRDTALQHRKARSDLSPSLPDNDQGFKVAVSGIWNIPGLDALTNAVLVACEGLPALFEFEIGSNAKSATTISLNGNALDVAFIKGSDNSCSIVVSIDNIHKAGSTTLVRKDKIAARLQYFSKQTDGQWQEDEIVGKVFVGFAGQGSLMDDEATNGDTPIGNGADQASSEKKSARDILYSVENLRKRPGAEE
ncbi:guanine-N(7)--methyltransferase subunit TRM82 [Setomelanomma holmii]|uniref:Guanine-N(7)--methyltransferase subunit TRM82 n=1 Tax=Setomelanomma holmii TaxID=210430 RepID=A0A9P4H1C1_9PLEO|nr:guanine-N(7)--methyltransferase subunit TRM82 [Setomelanomma holmii]